MKKIPVEQSLGMTLCHDITAERRIQGAQPSGGATWSREDIPRLLDLGKRHLVWEEQAGEITKKTQPGAWLRQRDRRPIRNPRKGKYYWSRTERPVRVNTICFGRSIPLGDLTTPRCRIIIPQRRAFLFHADRAAGLTRKNQLLRAEALCRETKLLDLKPYRERESA